MDCVLLGYGTVGKNVKNLCDQLPDFHIKNVFVRPGKEQPPVFCSDGKALVTDPEVQIVFECLNGLEPANTLIREALKEGKHVISSNKAVLSTYLPDYLALAREHGGTLQIEASVAGGIPFIDALLRLSAAEQLEGFDAILNGTSNYILSRMEKDGISFESALAQAQELGYAEANPAADIEGTDVWYKTRLAASLLSHAPLPELPKPLGISRVQAEDITLAQDLGRIIRHISMVRYDNGKLATLIAPVFLKKDDYLGAVHQNYNGQLIYGKSFGSLGFYGPGAGGSPTAQAMVADALDVLHNRIRPIELNQSVNLNPDGLRLNWIVRSFQDLSDLSPSPAAPSKQKNVWFFTDRTPQFIEKVQAIDPEAMIGVWSK